jgi:hypothetical protein
MTAGAARRRRELRGRGGDEVVARVRAAVGLQPLAPVPEAAAEVIAGAERAARAAQHDDLHRGVAGRPRDGVLDLVGQRRTIVLSASGR